MAIRREIRLRKEFLHRKQVDVNEMIKSDKKRKIKSAIDEGKAIPTELRAEARALKHEMDLDVVPVEDRFHDFHSLMNSLVLYLPYGITSKQGGDRRRICPLGIKGPKSLCYNFERPEQ